MQILAVTSVCGGVGRSTVVSTMADIIRRRGRPVLALDLDPANALALHLGASARPPRGVGQALASALNPTAPIDWPDTALVNSDGLQFLPFGSLDAPALAAIETYLSEPRAWLRDQLKRVQLPAETVVVVDTPRLPSALARLAIDTADLVLTVLAADVASYAALPVITATPGRSQHYVVNGLEPNRPLQNDVRLLLREELGAQLAPMALHRDGSLADAQARNRALIDDAPHSQSAQDFELLTAWMLRELEKVAH